MLVLLWSRGAFSSPSPSDVHIKARHQRKSSSTRVYPSCPTRPKGFDGLNNTTPHPAPVSCHSIWLYSTMGSIYWCLSVPGHHKHRDYGHRIHSFIRNAPQWMAKRTSGWLCCGCQAKPPVGIKVIHIVNRVPLLLILLPMDRGRGWGQNHCPM